MNTKNAKPLEQLEHNPHTHAPTHLQASAGPGRLDAIPATSTGVTLSGCAASLHLSSADNALCAGLPPTVSSQLDGPHANVKDASTKSWHQLGAANKLAASSISPPNPLKPSSALCSMQLATAGRLPLTLDWSAGAHQASFFLAVRAGPAPCGQVISSTGQQSLAAYRDQHNLHDSPSSTGEALLDCHPQPSLHTGADRDACAPAGPTKQAPAAAANPLAPQHRLKKPVPEASAEVPPTAEGASAKPSIVRTPAGEDLAPATLLHSFTG